MTHAVVHLSAPWRPVPMPGGPLGGWSAPLVRGRMEGLTGWTWPECRRRGFRLVVLGSLKQHNLSAAARAAADATPMIR